MDEEVSRPLTISLLTIFNSGKTLRLPQIHPGVGHRVSLRARRYADLDQISDGNAQLSRIRLAGIQFIRNQSDHVAGKLAVIDAHGVGLRRGYIAR